MYRIRFHGRGGQGMKTASRILGTAFFLEGFEVQDAPRYGAERRGAPIFAFVRADRSPINERGIIHNPDLVIVADDSLVGVPAAGVLAGLDAHSLLLINSHEDEVTWRGRLNLSGPVLILPAAEDVEDRATMAFAGTLCAGAAARLVGVIGREALFTAVRQELSHLGDAIVRRNLERAGSAFDAMASHAGAVTPRPAEAPAASESPAWVDLPFEAARRSAPVIHGALTSAVVKTGLWRTMRPVVDYEHCHRCWWVCSTYCPDGAIAVDDEGRPEIDYDHCKGCLVCVAQCPAHAIGAVPEHQAQTADGGQAP